MSDISLTLRGAEVVEPPRTINEKYLVVLRDCLHATHTASLPLQECAERVDALTRSCTGSGDGDVDIEAHLDALWNVLLDVVGQIQIDDKDDKRVMERLARLIVELSKLDCGSVEIWGTNSKLWEDLPLLGPMLRESWNEPDEHMPEEKHPAWARMNAFLALLVARQQVEGIRKPSFSEFPVWTLRGALEEEFTTPLPSFVSARVMAAVHWFRHAGEFLLEQCRSKYRAQDEMFTRVTRPGKLFQGAPGMSLERFRFWRARLEELSQGLEDEMTMKQAKEAAGMATNLLDHHLPGS